MTLSQRLNARSCRNQKRAALWLGMQMDYGLWQAEQKPKPRVERTHEVPTTEWRELNNLSPS